MFACQISVLRTDRKCRGYPDIGYEAVKQIPPVPFRVPEGVQLVRVNHKTGMPAKPSDKVVVLEAFKLDDDVTKKSVIIGEKASSISSDEEDMGAPDLGAFY